MKFNNIDKEYNICDYAFQMLILIINKYKNSIFFQLNRNKKGKIDIQRNYFILR
jgi:hypothetical protein